MTRAADIKIEHVQKALEVFKEWFPEDFRRLEPFTERLTRDIIEGNRFDAPEELLGYEHVDLLTEEDYETFEMSPCLFAVGVAIFQGVMLVISLFGLRITHQEKTSRAFLRVMGSDVLNGLKSIVHNLGVALKGRAWKRAAVALFELMGGAWRAGGFRLIFRALKEQLTWYDWAFTVISVIAQLTAWFATGGAIFVAKVVIVIADAAFFIRSVLEAVTKCSR